MEAQLATFNDLVIYFFADPLVAPGKWFGKACLKVRGKAFAVMNAGDMAFKLTGDAYHGAMAIEGARHFDPRGQGQAFREWVQVPAVHAAQWTRLAEAARTYVNHN